MTPLERVTVVLFEPQDDINIGNTVRACKNFGVTNIRLVRPRVADPERILISAPRSQDTIAAIEHFDSLEDALADCALVVGTSARHRKVKRLYLEPRGAAAELVEVARDQRVAVLFGREDSGLPNEALDLCNFVVSVPTNPDYSSLNLGQAVLLMMWEIFRQAQDVPVERPAARLVRPDSEHPPATQEALDRLFSQMEDTLVDIDFLKPSSHEHIRRTMREMFLRMGLDSREVSIWHGVFSQVKWATYHKPRPDQGEDV